MAPTNSHPDVTPSADLEGPLPPGAIGRGVAASLVSATFSRKAILTGLAATAGVGIAGTASAGLASAATTSQQRISVIDLGAKGDGVTDDTNAVRAAVTAAAGSETYFPPGTYVLDGLVVDGIAHLCLDPQATLLAKPNSATGAMIQFSGSRLVVTGGTIDGNRLNQTGRPVVVAGVVEKPTSISLANVQVRGTVKAVLYLTSFGGSARITGCTFTDQAEHTGVLNEGLSTIVHIGSGQVGSKGSLQFNDNRAIGTTTPREPGSNPGGLFVSPSTTSDPQGGNLSTVEVCRNYFWGYGQNLAGNTISAIHLYRATLAARVVGNYFEDCSTAPITAKAVTDFACVNNVCVGTALSPQNPSSLGVISYLPGYNSGTSSRQRAIISGNIIENAGGQSSSVRQNGISVHGTSTSRGRDVVVEGNVIVGGGVGIHILQSDDVHVSGNVIKSGATGVQAYDVGNIALIGNTIAPTPGGAAGTAGGITLANLNGRGALTGNIIESKNGHGIQAILGMRGASLIVQGNRIEHASPGYHAAVLRGVATLKLTANEVRVASGGGLDVRAESGGSKVGRLHYDLSNSVIGGPSTFLWADILAASGQLRDQRSPLGAIVPAEVGTTYQQTDGVGDAVMWIAAGLTSGSWVKFAASGSGPGASNKMLGVSFDPASANVAQPVAPSGVLHSAKLTLTSGGAPTRIMFNVAKAGASLTAGLCFVGLYDASGRLLAKSADIATVLSTTGTKTVGITPKPEVLVPGATVFVGLVWNGTTAPELSGVNGGLANVGLSDSTDLRYAVGGSGLTGLPAVRPTSTAVATAAWFGIS